ncbi:hypothetical protein [Mycolicibacterium sp.]|uniref:hypothetical protein n=1 Tax=Mycolicibacterium sp. TaxID=2320850 RepID=UPI0037C6CB0A
MPAINTDQKDDDDPVTIDYASRVRVQTWTSERDGTLVVQVDTHEDTGRIRINLNDGPIWDGDPDTDNPPGAYFENG